MLSPTPDCGGLVEEIHCLMAGIWVASDVEFCYLQQFARTVDAPSITLSGPVEIDAVYVSAGLKGRERDQEPRSRGLATRGRGSYAGDKPPVLTCQLRSVDYHHWRHEPDRGVCLCRTCHDAISGQQTDKALDWQAQELGLKNKYDFQITRLALREQAISDRGSLQAFVERINSRYNLFQTPAHTYSLLSQILSDQTVLDAISDGYLLAELSS